jgi:hypothetical protein
LDEAFPESIADFDVTPFDAQAHGQLSGQTCARNNLTSRWIRAEEGSNTPEQLRRNTWSIILCDDFGERTRILYMYAGGTAVSSGVNHQIAQSAMQYVSARANGSHRPHLVSKRPDTTGTSATPRPTRQASIAAQSVSNR